MLLFSESRESSAIFSVMNPKWPIFGIRDCTVLVLSVFTRVRVRLSSVLSLSPFLVLGYLLVASNTYNFSMHSTVLSEATKPFVKVFLNHVQSFLSWSPSSSSIMPNLASASSQIFSQKFPMELCTNVVHLLSFQSKNAWLGLHNYFFGIPGTRSFPTGY